MKHKKEYLALLKKVSEFHQALAKGYAVLADGDYTECIVTEVDNKAKNIIESVPPNLIIDNEYYFMDNLLNEVLENVDSFVDAANFVKENAK